MQNVQRIVLVDFGAQYTQLIARRVREANVFCEVVSYLTPLSEILDKKPVGIILSGGPASVLDADAPHIDPAIYEQGIPVLGICYGMQLTAYTLGGTVERAAQREYGRIPVEFRREQPAVCRHESAVRRVDEPHLPRHPCAGGLHLHRPQRELRVLRDGEPGKAHLRGAVPSGSHPQRRGPEGHRQLPVQRLRLHGRLDDEHLHRQRHLPPFASRSARTAA